MSDPRNFFAHSLLRAHNWQPRPQLDDVSNWWRRGGRGVCALIGMGGAGKTAVAERFLRILPGGLPADPQNKDGSLPTPHSVFVFSFYDAPNADAFFESLQMWLENTPRVETLLSVGQMMFMLQQRQGLIVLDGLERMQHDGQRGDFGRLESPKLRDFLNQLAAGYFADLSVLVTSRFPLADLRDRNPQFFHPIPVNQIEVAAGVQLLRDRGVRGTDPQLEPIVEQCGRHALTVDFAGGFIAEYGQGDPATPLNLGTAEELQAASEQDELDEDQREIARQGFRFARIAGHYRDAMLEKDEASMALLERICLFRLGVDSETLAAIFTGKDAAEVSGQALAALNSDQLQKKLDWLVRMRIVEATPWHGHPGREASTSEHNDITGRMPVPRYSIHPAVRDGFLSGISRDAAVAGHEAVRKGLEVSLGDAPGENPSDPATLDLLEEIVHHTLQSGHVREAWDFYENRMGQYQNLGWRLGAYERGERICRAFAGGQSSEFVVQSRPDQAERSSGSTTPSPSPTMPEHRRSAPRSGLHDGDSWLPTEGDAPSTSRHLPLGEGRGEGAAPRRMPFLDLPEDEQAVFINEWALYLQALGRLAAAARCYELHNEMRMRREDWTNASFGNQNLCDVWLLSGRLSRLPQAEDGRTAAVIRRQEETDESLPPSSFVARPSAASPAPLSKGTLSARLGASSAGALATADEALRLAELADDAEGRCFSHASRGHAAALRGEVPDALADFHLALDLQQKLVSRDSPLFSARGIQHYDALIRVGRHEQATRLATRAKEIQEENWGPTDFHIPKYQLVLSSLSLARSVSASSSSGSSAALWTRARDWALARDAKEVLCWSCLVEAQHALARGTAILAVEDADSRAGSPCHDVLATALESGLKIARDCGYGLYHIDLLLERARLRLLQGDAQAALDDIELALDKGIPADEETGQPELVAASHPACGYAWPIPFGLQLRAEALLLQVAQQLGSDSFTPKELDDLSGEVADVINQAKSLLQKALELWQPLHDPEPERPDQNFQLDGKQYNYKARETHTLLLKLTNDLPTMLSELAARCSAAEPGKDEGASQMNLVKTVVELDLAGYSSIGRMLEQNLGTNAVQKLNDQIQGFVDRALEAVGCDRATNVMKTTGDGAILAFDDASDAHGFAEALYAAAGEFNAGKTEATARRDFRVGAATGEITISESEDGTRDIAGTTIADAVRLEAAANPGEFLVDQATYNLLPTTGQQLYGPEEEVAGKRDERYKAYRFAIDRSAQAPTTPAVTAKAASGDRRAILSLFDDLNPPDQLDRLMYLLDVSVVDQPAETLTIRQRQDAILKWAKDQPNGLAELESELRFLVERQSP